MDLALVVNIGLGCECLTVTKGHHFYNMEIMNTDSTLSLENKYRFMMEVTDTEKHSSLSRP
jgi:hypothetical protein